MSSTSRPSAAQRFAARARRRRLRRLLSIVSMLLGLGAVVAIVWAVGWSDLLAVRNVDVDGADDALAAEVKEAAEAPTGTPLVRVEVEPIAERVRELPEVATVEIHRSWPSGLTIEVTPRVGVAAMSDGEEWWSVDEHGVMFGASESRPEGLPVIEAPVEASGRATRAAGVAVVTGLPHDLRVKVEEVRAESEADVRLVLDDGAEVVWGTAERGDDKAEVLAALIAAQDETPRRYDVSAPDRPAVRP